MADSFSIVYAALSAIIADEFSDEKLTAQPDKMHESLGWEGAVAGIYPESQRPKFNDYNTAETVVRVQVFNEYEKDVDPYQQTDPRVITGWADRFVKAVERQQATYPGSSEVWYFQVTGLDFPDDPTGNKTRFVATVRALGQNPAGVETTS